MAPAPAPCVDQIDALRAALAGDTIDRATEIELTLLALVARHHLFFLGEPGVAKSMLVDRAVRYIDGARCFDITLGKYTTDAELFGPPSITALKQDRIERIIDGMLPVADVAIVNEIGRASSSLVNMLLELFNERTYKNGAVKVLSNLATVLLTSNTTLDSASDEMAAIWDRVLLRRVVPNLVSPASIRALYDLDIDPAPRPVLTWPEMQAIQAEAARVKVLPDAKDALVEIVQKLRAAQIVPSGRRQLEFLKIVRSHAWIAGESEADVSSLEPGIHVFWEHPEQIPLVERIVLEIAAPAVKDVLALSDTVVETCDAVAKVLAEIDEHDKTRGASVPFPDPLMGRVMDSRAKIVRSAASIIAKDPNTKGRAKVMLDDLWRRVETDWAAIVARGMHLSTIPDLRREAA